MNAPDPPCEGAKEDKSGGSAFLLPWSKRMV
jgi:hypothetical protein